MTSNRFPPGYIPLTIHELNGGIASLSSNGHVNGADRSGPRSHGRSNGGGGGGGGDRHRGKRKNNRPRGGGRREHESFDEE